MITVKKIKRLLSVFLALIVMMTAFAGLSVSAAAKTSKWEGYLKISSAADLLRMNNSSQKFYLTKDIDLKDYGLWEEEIEFNGTLDGNGYCIKNLTSTQHGLFRYLSGATILNLGLTNVNIKTSRSYAGALGAWRCYDTTIENCYVTGSIESTGGSAAGFIGYDESGPGSGSGSSGGGRNTFKNCVNMADITGQRAAGIYCNPLSTDDKDIISGCVNYGNISGTKYAGGICYQLNTTMKSCFNLGEVSVIKDDGLAGGITYRAKDSGYMMNCATITATDIGTATSNSMAQADTSVSKSKLQKASTYKDFDFGKTWAIGSKVNDGYPVLATMLKNYNGSKPVASNPAGSYKNSVDVELTTDIKGAVIRYTTNGKTPSTSSKKYTGAITVSKNTTIKAAVFVNGVRGKVVTLKYTIK